MYPNIMWHMCVSNVMVTLSCLVDMLAIVCGSCDVNTTSKLLMLTLKACCSLFLRWKKKEKTALASILVYEENEIDEMAVIPEFQSLS